MSDGDGAAKEIGENATFVPTDVSITVKWFNTFSQCFASWFNYCMQSIKILINCAHVITSFIIVSFPD